jgi:hypothetical protein
VKAALAGLLAELRVCSGASCQARPALKLKLDYRQGREHGHRCAEEAVKAIVKGLDRGLLVGGEFRVGSKGAGSDDTAPIRERIARSKLKRRGKSEVIATVTLLDGREMSLDKTVRRCG